MKLVAFFLLIIPSICYSSGVNDSLVQLINLTQEDTVKINLLNELAYLQIDTSYETASITIAKAEELSRRIEFDKGLAICLYNKGRNLAYNNDFEAALVSINQAKDILEKMSSNRDDLVRCHILLGWVNDRMTLYYKALQHYEKAGEYIEQYNLKSNLGNVYINIGRIHNFLGDYQTALTYYNKAGEKYKATENTTGLAYYYTNIGYIYYQNEDYDQAHRNYDAALALTNDPSLIRLKSNILQNKIVAYIDSNEPQKAEELVTRVYALDSSINDEIGLAYLSIAEARIDQFKSHAEKHIASLRAAYELGVDKKDVELQRESAAVLAELYTSNGNFEKAITHSSVANKLKDSIADADLKLKIKNLENRKEIELQKKDQLLEESAMKQSLDKQKFIKIVLSISLFILSLFSFFLYRNFRDLLKTKNELEVKNTELIKAEANLEEKNKDLEKYIEHNIELEQFAHIASHDIKSPLRTISSFSGLLKKQLSGTMTEEQKSHFNFIEKGVSRLSDLVSDLLDYSVINSQELNITEFSARELFNEISENLKFDLDEIDCHFLYHGDSLVVLGDKIKLKQILQNLVSNSIKFYDDSVKPEIVMSCHKDVDYTYFSIADNGIGLEPKFAETIFEKFTQLNPKDKYEGTGMGLALCKKYAEKHGGKVWLDLDHKKGCKFTFTVKNDLASLH